jgi:hypothetical protein
MTFEHKSKNIINGVNDDGAVAYGFRILYSSIFESGEPVPSTSCSHSLILVVEPFVLHLFLLHDCFLPSWVIVTRPIEIDDI